MLVVFETVVNKFGPWVICFAMIGICLYEAHRHEETLVSINSQLTTALESVAKVHETQTELLARDGFILPPPNGPQPLR
jgi:hypothetical protein